MNTTPNGELLDRFIDELRTRGFSQCTLEAYRESCDGFAAMLGVRSLLEGTRSDIRAYLGALQSRNLASASIARHTAGLRAFYKWLQVSKRSDHNPTLLVAHRKIGHRLPRVLSIAEVKQLINAASRPLERAVVEILYSGTRR